MEGKNIFYSFSFFCKSLPISKEIFTSFVKFTVKNQAEKSEVKVKN